MISCSCGDLADVRSAMLHSTIGGYYHHSTTNTYDTRSLLSTELLTKSLEASHHCHSLRWRYRVKCSHLATRIQLCDPVEKFHFHQATEFLIGLLDIEQTGRKNSKGSSCIDLLTPQAHKHTSPLKGAGDSHNNLP